VSNLLRLLDLPDEALVLIEQGVLSEGHGRALLLAGEHDARRSLARSAGREQWSVRTLEQRARESNANGAGPAQAKRQAVHPDQSAACAAIADALAAALGAEVHVAVARGGSYRAELSFASPEEALELAQRLGAANPR
jgi:ParB family chromosome partitioning protein